MVEELPPHFDKKMGLQLNTRRQTTYFVWYVQHDMMIDVLVGVLPAHDLLFLACFSLLLAPTRARMRNSYTLTNIWSAVKHREGCLVVSSPCTQTPPRSSTVLLLSLPE